MKKYINIAALVLLTPFTILGLVLTGAVDLQGCWSRKV
jgi:hypothetical protein